jgi:type I restriction enzyme M protein
LGKQIDLLYKLAARAADAAVQLAADEQAAEHLDRRGMSRQLKDLDAKRHDAVEQLKQAVYYHRQVVWLQERFPDAQFRPVPGLVKVVDNAEIEAADWSLTPGRYVGVAPPEADDDFDFEQTIRDIHLELAGLNEEAAALARKIQDNFEDLGI